MRLRHKFEPEEEHRRAERRAQWETEEQEQRLLMLEAAGYVVTRR